MTEDQAVGKFSVFSDRLSRVQECLSSAAPSVVKGIKEVECGEEPRTLRVSLSLSLLDVGRKQR